MIQATRLEDGGTASRRERLAVLFDANQQRLHRLARRLSRDAEESRDLVQETFLRAARRPGAIPADEAHAAAWLVKVLVNLCRDRGRRLAVRRDKTPREQPPQAAPDPESAAVARSTVQAALARLSPRRRAVIVLHELEEQPVQRVAELLGLSRVTVRWHLSAARKQLARMLAPMAAGDGENP